LIFPSQVVGAEGIGQQVAKRPWTRRMSDEHVGPAVLE
jgi:hypothetical protein